MFKANDNNPNSQQIPAAPVLAHVKALLDAGHTPSTIAHQAGIETRRVTTLLGAHSERGATRQAGYERRVYRRIAEPILAIPIPEGMFVPALGPVRRLRALVRIGHAFHAIAAELGLGYTGRDLAELALGRPEIIDAELADALVALYDRWHYVPGESVEARELGREHGFAAPLAWAIDDDDTAGSIDDPTAEPVGVDRPDRRRWRPVPADFPEVVAEHRELGRFDEEIADSMGLALNTFAKRLHRAGLVERRRGNGDHATVRPLYGARFRLRTPHHEGAQARLAGIAS
ncbi:hypothetical protein [Mycobacterium aquaticum]|uniref:Uncharacterized protein n=1 Tax=Mycobacterium aquaticum TaxID=1927124 RepID=A0A1X0A4E5_9MYCO|nr:hypothetical protein [Mycobacterium aquaticum]ORA24939.1 hypothetical protein BST13_33770 [Mycobacterium aquaticum]